MRFLSLPLVFYHMNMTQINKTEGDESDEFKSHYEETFLSSTRPLVAMMGYWRLCVNSSTKYSFLSFSVTFFLQSPWRLNMWLRLHTRRIVPFIPRLRKRNPTQEILHSVCNWISSHMHSMTILAIKIPRKALYGVSPWSCESMSQNSVFNSFLFLWLYLSLWFWFSQSSDRMVPLSLSHI